MPAPTCIRQGCGQAANVLPNIEGGEHRFYCSEICAASDIVRMAIDANWTWCDKHGKWEFGGPCELCWKENNPALAKAKESPHECPECGQRFKTIGGATRHLLTAHGA